MLTPILYASAGGVLFILLSLFIYAVWVAHKKTLMERVPVSGHPSRWGLIWQDVVFRSREDEVVLSGWYLAANPDDRCIILLQGTQNHRNAPAVRALRLGRDLVERGFSVLMFDFRARGQSAGIRSSEGDREQWDLLGAIDYVKGRGIPVERIGLLGFSLGAGVAILVAAQEPDIPAIVSDCGFLDYMMDLGRLHIGPLPLPGWFAYFVALAGRVFFKADFGKVRPAEVVGEVSQPIFFIHGQNDTVVPVEESKELHSISDNREDRIWIVPDAEHINIYQKMPEEYVARVSAFFKRHID